MSMSHHGSDDSLVRRFLEQVEGTPKRQFSAGRIGPDDDGDLAFAIATDKAHKRVILRFGKPVEWVGLNAKDCVYLAEQLIQRAKEISSEPITVSL